MLSDTPQGHFEGAATGSRPAGSPCRATAPTCVITADSRHLAAVQHLPHERPGKSLMRREAGLVLIARARPETVRPLGTV